MEVEHAQGLSTTNLYPTNTGVVGHGSEVREGNGLAVGRKGEPILGFLLKLFWGKYPARMTYHLKEGRMNWNH